MKQLIIFFFAALLLCSTGCAKKQISLVDVPDAPEAIEASYEFSMPDIELQDMLDVTIDFVMDEMMMNNLGWFR